MRTRLLSIVALLASMAGCLLVEEDCGFGFELDGDRCVPVRTPPPFGSAPGDGGVEPDGGVQLVDLGPPVDAAVDEDWLGFEVVLIVDRTARSDITDTPDTPGADIDAVQAIEQGVRGDQRIGQGAVVEGDFLLDPFEDNAHLEPEAVVGLPDGEAASLGGDGGYLYVRLELMRSLRGGDVIVVVERNEQRAPSDVYELYLCREPDDTLQACRALGRSGTGVGRFTLD